MDMDAALDVANWEHERTVEAMSDGEPRWSAIDCAMKSGVPQTVNPPSPEE